VSSVPGWQRCCPEWPLGKVTSTTSLEPSTRQLGNELSSRLCLVTHYNETDDLERFSDIAADTVLLFDALICVKSSSISFIFSARRSSSSECSATAVIVGPEFFFFFISADTGCTLRKERLHHDRWFDLGTFESASQTVVSLRQYF
jgi:hypothetical protein